jgi:PAS domain S-box-containing protein
VVTKFQLRESLFALQGYGLAVFAVSVALGMGLLVSSYGFRGVELPLYLFAIAVTAWYAGAGPSAVAVVLSILSFDYFVEPRYTIYPTVAEIPYLIICTAFAALVAWFSSVSRRVEEQFRQARDRLETLDLAYDAILVRDMNAVITHWNRGAEEMYGWTPQQAIGKRSHELFQTVFPAPLVDIEAELLRTGRWEGELKHTKPDGSLLVVSSRWTLRRDEGGRPAAILETNNDITSRKRREEEIRALNEKPLQLAELAGEMPRGHGETVMIVDERALVALAEETLTQLGYEPVGFDSSVAALQAFRAGPKRFDLVLTDETMPDLTGTELAREIRQLRPDISVILMSRDSDTQLSERAQAAGVIEVLRKPLVRRDIAEPVARALHGDH